MLDPIYKSVGQDFYGPINLSGATPNHAQPGVLLRFKDTFSILGWGRMPDTLPGLGDAQLAIHHHLAQKTSDSNSWKDFFRSPDALTFRKAASSIPMPAEANLAGRSESIGSMLNDIADGFPMNRVFQGLTYAGLVPDSSLQNLNPHDRVTPDQCFAPQSVAAFQLIQEERAPVSQVMGRAAWDYGVFRKSSAPRVLPFEIHSHFELTDSSLATLTSEMKRDSLVIPMTSSTAALQVGAQWDFPIQEVVLAHDPFARRIGFSEAMWMTGYAPKQIQELCLTAAWVGAFIRYTLKKAGMNLQSIPLQFAEGANGAFMVSSRLSFSELKVAMDGVSLHTDILMKHYAKTSWYDAVMRAQKTARNQGLMDWKRLVLEPVPFLDVKMKTAAERMLPSVAHWLTGSTVEATAGHMNTPQVFSSITELKACFLELKLV